MSNTKTAMLAVALVAAASAALLFLARGSPGTGPGKSWTAKKTPYTGRVCEKEALRALDDWEVRAASTEQFSADFRRCLESLLNQTAADYCAELQRVRVEEHGDLVSGPCPLDNDVRTPERCKRVIRAALDACD